MKVLPKCTGIVAVIKPTVTWEKFDLPGWRILSCDRTKIREFKILRLRTTTTVKHATAHDHNHVTVHFSRVVLRLRWVVELFHVVGTKDYGVRQTQTADLQTCRHVRNSQGVGGG